MGERLFREKDTELPVRLEIDGEFSEEGTDRKRRGMRDERKK